MYRLAACMAGNAWVCRCHRRPLAIFWACGRVKPPVGQPGKLQGCGLARVVQDGVLIGGSSAKQRKLERAIADGFLSLRYDPLWMNSTPNLKQGEIVWIGAKRHSLAANHQSYSIVWSSRLEGRLFLPNQVMENLWQNYIHGCEASAVERQDILQSL